MPLRGTIVKRFLSRDRFVTRKISRLMYLHEQAGKKINARFIFKTTRQRQICCVSKFIYRPLYTIIYICVCVCVCEQYFSYLLIFGYLWKKQCKNYFWCFLIIIIIIIIIFLVVLLLFFSNSNFIKILLKNFTKKKKEYMNICGHILFIIIYVYICIYIYIYIYIFFYINNFLLEQLLIIWSLNYSWGKIKQLLWQTTNKLIRASARLFLTMIFRIIVNKIDN